MSPPKVESTAPSFSMIGANSRKINEFSTTVGRKIIQLGYLILAVVVMRIE
jgi:hypothetical protein